MTIDKRAVASLVNEIENLGLLSKAEVAEINSAFQSCFPFADGIRLAESVHLNIKVDDVDCIPEEFLKERQAKKENAKDGYVKYAFGNGANIILSSIPISQDDLIEAKVPENGKRSRPFLDHIGIDLREESTPLRSLFDAVPYLASKAGWPHVSQGGPGKPVFCCHVQVGAKDWVYPRRAESGVSIPLEFAFGPLVINELKSGCDLRPSDPQTVPAGATESACSAG